MYTIGLIVFHAIFITWTLSRIRQTNLTMYAFDGQGSIEKRRRLPEFKEITKTVTVIVLWVSLSIWLH